MFIAAGLLLPLIHINAHTFCLFEKILHIPCPFCGIRTSVFAFVHGDFRGAFMTNPAGPIILIALISYLIYFTLATMCNLKVQFNREVTAINKINGVILSLLIMQWIYKIIGGI